jgi:outer membrane autotransporter protein
MTRTTAYQHLQKTILRGGRLTKWKGIVASLAPMVGVVVVAGGVSVSTPTMVLAGSCTQTAPGSGIWTCKDGAGADSRQHVFAPSGKPVVVTTEPGFGLNVGSNGIGILITTNGSSTGISFADNEASPITALLRGIDATNSGTGALSITSTGTVTATNNVSSFGIYAINRSTGSDLKIHAANTQGGDNGIYARNYGSGALSITSTGTAKGIGNVGIVAANSGTDLRIDAADTQGGWYGIYARNDGTGALTVTSTGTTTGTGNDGIRAYNNIKGTAILITIGGTVTGGDDGIDARNFGTAGLTIAANADVTGNGGMGIRAFNSANDTTASMLINQAAGTTTTGAIDGINANNAGGSLTINALGIAVGTTGSGIYAINNVGTTSLTVTSYIATGGENGIAARNNGSGALSITSTGTATGSGTYNSGIWALNYGTNLTINAADTTGGRHGISALNYGSGALSVTSTGTATGGADRSGIRARNSGTNLTINAADTKGGRYGIYASNKGTGALSVTSTGTATATGADPFSTGIWSRNYGTDLTIAAAGVNGGSIGIFALNYGTGATAITTTGEVIGKNGSGIFAQHFGEGNLEITVNGDVSGAMDLTAPPTYGPYGAAPPPTDGITAVLGDFGGTGSLIIKQAANTTIRGYRDGINASNAGTDIIIAAANVTGGRNGIRAVNYGSGSVSITATGTVSALNKPEYLSSADAGVFAWQLGDGDLTMDVQNVYGYGNGIFAQHSGTGAMSVTARGDVVGNAYHGIVAEQGGAGDLTIDVVNVRGGIYGIVAVSDGGGNTSITTRGTIIGEGPGWPEDGDVVGGRFQDTGADGIRARNFNAGNMSITIAEGSSVEGFVDGIRADNQRQAGTDYYGVPYNQTGDMVISVLGSVSGGRDGIRVGQQGDGVFTVTISGSVYGGQNGLHNSYVEFYEYRPTYTRGGTFTITETGSLTGGLDGAGVAFRDSARTLIFTDNDPSSHLQIFGKINGDVVMGEGSDRITVSGPSAVLVSGLGRYDVVRFNGDGDGFTPYNLAAYSYFDPVAGGKYEFTPIIYNDGEQVDRLTFSNWSGSTPEQRDDVQVADIDGWQILNIEEVFLTDDADVTFADQIDAGWGLSNLSGNERGLLLQVDEGSIARFLDDFTVFGNVNNFGALDLSTPNLTAGTTLTITGNYAAASDLFLDVSLNDGGPDNVPANDAVFADQVFIGGNVSGVTHVFVNNIGGTGAITDLNRNGLVDSNEGILIVQVEGATPLDTDTAGVALAEHFRVGSAANTFVSTATGRTNVSVGAFAYDIYTIGANATGNVNGTTDYVLANTGKFSPVAPVYEVYPSFLLGQLGLPRLQERVGNRHWARPAAEPQAVAAEPVYVFCKDPAQNFRCEVTAEQAQVYADPLFGSVGADTGTVIEGQGLWVRADGMLSRSTPVESTAGAGYEARAAGLQFGYDHVLSESERGKLIGGINLSYRTATADVTSDTGLGEIATSGYGLGASLTWYAQNGFYIDAQAQAVWLDSDLSADGLGQFAEGHETEGYGLSLEMGKEIALSETWAITPQAQLSYATVQEPGFTDALGTLVSFKAESLQLRLGVELSNEESWEAEDGTTSRRSLRAGAHVIHEFKPETTVVVGGTPLRSKSDATMAEITLGGTYNWSDDRNSVYAEIGASTGLDNFGDSHRLRGTVGFRQQWE